jgi:hypothetical protein
MEIDGELSGSIRLAGSSTNPGAQHANGTTEIRVGGNVSLSRVPCGRGLVKTKTPMCTNHKPSVADPRSER